MIPSLRRRRPPRAPRLWRDYMLGRGRRIVFGHRRDRPAGVGRHPDPQPPGPRDFDPAGFDHRVDQLDLPARPYQEGGDIESRGRYRAEQFEGEPRQLLAALG